MKAIRLTDSTPVFEPDYAPPDRSADLVAVDVLTAGICETDLQLIQGYMGFQGVLGHEFVGIATSGKFRGKRVVGEINCACQNCDFCQRGLERHCPNRTVIGILNHDGAFAEQVLVPEQNLHRVPDSLPSERAVFTEPVAAACRIAEQLDLTAVNRSLILGAGRLGNLCAQVLRSHGVNVRVVGKHDWKLQHLTDLEIAVERLGEFQPSPTFDLVVDCTGSPTGLPLAMQCTKPRGTIVVKTTVAATLQIPFAPVVIDEFQIIGSRCGPFQPALQLLDSGDVQVDQMISERYPLEDGLSALKHAERPDALKVLLDIA